MADKNLRLIVTVHLQHDDDCGESIAMTGACRHGHAFFGGCDKPFCPFADEEDHR